MAMPRNMILILHTITFIFSCNFTKLIKTPYLYKVIDPQTIIFAYRFFSENIVFSIDLEHLPHIALFFCLWLILSTTAASVN